GGGWMAITSGELGALDPTRSDTMLPARGSDVESCGRGAPHPPPRLLTTVGMHGETVSVMICTQVAVFPHASVAVQVRVIVPPPGHPPDRASEEVTTGFGSQVSLAVAIPVTTGLVEPPHLTLTSGGQAIVGGVVSFTVISCVHVAVLPQESCA